MTAPANGSTFAAGSNVTLSATASDPGGSIAKVEFFTNGTLRGTDTTSPYSITWSNAAAGSYSVTARATDNIGLQTTSTAVSITVSAANVPPTVSLTSPANGATFTMPVTVTLTASASDANGSVTKVEFFAGTSLISSDTSAPYSASWSPGASGTYVLTARATDNAGAMTTSAGVSATVAAAPSFTILVNGSFDTNTNWVQPGSPEFNAIAGTFDVTPLAWPWATNSFSEVLPPYYNGIIQGGFDLAQFLNGLPAGEVRIVSHSHGGNVVLMSQAWSSRQISRYIQLATPVNLDFGQWRLALGYTVSARCQVSSSADWVQFFGASPAQVANFIYSYYQSIAGAVEAFQELIAGNYDLAYAWMSSSVFDALVADAWWSSTKYEVEGPTKMLSGLSHSQLHEPSVWSQLGSVCY